MNRLHVVLERMRVGLSQANLHGPLCTAARWRATATAKLAPERSRTRVFCAIVKLFAALWSSTVPAGTEPPIPSTVSAQFVADKMSTNGLPMQIWELRSALPPNNIHEFYRQQWKNETGLRHYTVGGWTVTGVFSAKRMMTVQLMKGTSDTFGYLAVTELGKADKRVRPGQGVPLPAGAKVLTDTSSIDGPHKGRTVVYQSGQSPQAITSFYRDHYLRRSWAEDRIPASNTKQQMAQFRNRADTFTVALTRDRGKTQAIAVLVEH